jgi:EAL and modified HD-GYP domain-containing signal transduction protein
MSAAEPHPSRAPTRDCFIGRQPILDDRQRLVGYELLFRSAAADQHAPGGGDPDATSLRVIGNALSVFGLDALTGGKLAFINFTGDLLLSDHAFLLPPGRAVIEVLETVRADPAVLAACGRLRRAGYKIALDDYSGDPASDALVDIMDIIKVDFRSTTPEKRRQLAGRLARWGPTLLAEKVETWEEQREAAELGYRYFQGYFFCRPETLSRPAPVPARLSYLRLLEELNRPEIDYARVEQVVKQEAALAVKLLSYMNSALFGWRAAVTSIRHAAVLLGAKNLRRWANVIALMGLCDGKPPELFVTAIVRGRFCELLGREASLGLSPFDLFLTGLLSVLDAILDRPLEEALAQFTLADFIREAIRNGTNPAGRACALARACESGDWGRISEAASGVNVTEPVATEVYRRAVEWTTEATAALETGAPC